MYTDRNKIKYIFSQTLLGMCRLCMHCENGMNSVFNKIQNDSFGSSTPLTKQGKQANLIWSSFIILGLHITRMVSICMFLGIAT